MENQFRNRKCIECLFHMVGPYDGTLIYSVKGALLEEIGTCQKSAKPAAGFPIISPKIDGCYEGADIEQAI